MHCFSIAPHILILNSRSSRAFLDFSTEPMRFGGDHSTHVPHVLVPGFRRQLSNILYQNKLQVKIQLCLGGGYEPSADKPEIPPLLSSTAHK